MIIDLEAAAVETSQAGLGPDPDIAIAGLQDRPDPVTGRQALLVLPGALMEFTGDLGGGEDGQSRRKTGGPEQPRGADAPQPQRGPCLHSRTFGAVSTLPASDG